MSSVWSERERISRSYYICLCLMLGPVFWVFPVFLLDAILFSSWGGLAMLGIYTFFMVIAVLGLGTRYRSRGINPSSRTVVNYSDGHYFERIGADESEYA
ncbi:MAG: hypothetical protein ACFE7R_11285 [Candidatus Hodarchaeota archaeon]